jgi:hypothetical protein
MTPGDFAERVLAYCLELNATEIAGYRTDQAADRVGATPIDAHRFGFGRDVTYDQRPSLASAITAAARLGLYVYRMEDHDHIEPQGWTEQVKHLSA